MSIFLLYTLAVVIFAARAGAGKTDTGFSINDRRSSAWLVGFSIVVSCVGASATMGTVGLAFQVGTPAFWWLGSGAAGLCVLAVFLAGKVRQSRARTLPEIMENFFSPSTRLVVSIIIVAAWLSILAAQLTAAGRVVAAMTAMASLPSLLTGAALIALHTFLGGQAAIIRLDRWQALLIGAGLIMVMVWLNLHNPGRLAEAPVELVNEQFPLSRLIHFFLILGGSYVVCPMLFGRLLSARDERSARQGALGAAAGLAVISVVIVAIGLLSRGLIDPSTPSDAVLTTALETVFPSWLGLLMNLVLLSALVSSADSCLLTASVILSRDVLKHRDLTSTRGCVLALSLAGLSLTFIDKGILGFLLMANDVYVCGVVGPVFIGLICNLGKPARPGLMLAGIIAGGFLGLISSLAGAVYLSYVGLSVSVILGTLSIRPLKYSSRQEYRLMSFFTSGQTNKRGAAEGQENTADDSGR